MRPCERRMNEEHATRGIVVAAMRILTPILVSLVFATSARS
ncbi:MAG: hypothetical protein ACI89X_002566 [Planctomycetota bacterium]|jgi:hypothetical protein